MIIRVKRTSAGSSLDPGTIMPSPWEPNNQTAASPGFLGETKTPSEADKKSMQFFKKPTDKMAIIMLLVEPPVMVEGGGGEGGGMPPQTDRDSRSGVFF